MPIIYEPKAGESISTTTSIVVGMLNRLPNGAIVTFNFNGIDIEALKGTTPEEIQKAYSQEQNKRHQAYLASPEYQRHLEERAEKLRTTIGNLMITCFMESASRGDAF